MNRRKLILIICIICTVAVVVFFFISGAVELKRAGAAVKGLGEVFNTGEGEVQYLQGGSGPAVLVIHGAGGGCDMGRLLAELSVPLGYSWVAPSRFGYLDSRLKPGSSFSYERQAAACHELMQHLGYKSYAVMTLSAGGGSGLQIASDYPETVKCLIQLSASSHRASSEMQDSAHKKGDALVKLFSRDFLVWSAMKLFRGQFLSLCGIPRSDSKDLPDEVLAYGDGFMKTMLPASMRIEGILIDNSFPVPPETASRVRVPTLIVHAENDSLQLFEQGRYAHEQIAGSELLSFKTGGHFAIAVHRERINREIRRYLDENLKDSFY